MYNDDGDTRVCGVCVCLIDILTNVSTNESEIFIFQNLASSGYLAAAVKGS